MKSLSDTRRQRRRKEVRCELAAEEGRIEEDGKMEVDEEVDSKKKLDQRKKELHKQMRDITEKQKEAQDAFK